MLRWQWPLVPALMGVAAILILWIVFLVPDADESAIRWTLSALAQSLAGVLAIVVLLFLVLRTQAERARDAFTVVRDSICNVQPLQPGERIPPEEKQLSTLQTLLVAVRLEFCKALREEFPLFRRDLLDLCVEKGLTPWMYYVNLCALPRAVVFQLRDMHLQDASELERERVDALKAGLTPEWTPQFLPGYGDDVYGFYWGVQGRAVDLHEPEALVREITDLMQPQPLLRLESVQSLRDHLLPVLDRHRAFRHLRTTTQFRQFLRGGFAGIVGCFGCAIFLALLLLPAAGWVSPYFMTVPMAPALLGVAFLIVHWHRLVVSESAQKGKWPGEKP